MQSESFVHDNETLNKMLKMHMLYKKKLEDNCKNLMEAGETSVNMRWIRSGLITVDRVRIRSGGTGGTI